MTTRLYVTELFPPDIRAKYPPRVRYAPWVNRWWFDRANTGRVDWEGYKTHLADVAKEFGTTGYPLMIDAENDAGNTVFPVAVLARLVSEAAALGFLPGIYDPCFCQWYNKGLAWYDRARVELKSLWAVPRSRIFPSCYRKVESVGNEGVVQIQAMTDSMGLALRCAAARQNHVHPYLCQRIDEGGPLMSDDQFMADIQRVCGVDDTHKLRGAPMLWSEDLYLMQPDIGRLDITPAQAAEIHLHSIDVALKGVAV